MKQELGAGSSFKQELIVEMFRIMKGHIFTLIGILLMAFTACKPKPNANLQPSDVTGAQANEGLKNQQAIAKEILSIEYAFVDAMLHTNSAVFLAEVEPLADRLDKISKDLDTLGSFPTGLRDATLKTLDDAEKDLAQLIQRRKASGSLQPGSLRPEAAKITEPVTDRYYSAWASVMMKAGLDLRAKKEASGIDAK